jgi:hypothetical protein
MPSFLYADVCGREKGGGGRRKKKGTPLAKDGKDNKSYRKKSREKGNDGS